MGERERGRKGQAGRGEGGDGGGERDGKNPRPTMGKMRFRDLDQRVSIRVLTGH